MLMEVAVIQSMAHVAAARGGQEVAVMRHVRADSLVITAPMCASVGMTGHVIDLTAAATVRRAGWDRTVRWVRY